MSTEELTERLLLFIYDSPIWIVTGIAVVVPCVIASLAVVVTRWVVAEDYRRRHHEAFTFTINNIAVFYAVLLAFLAVAAAQSLSDAERLAETEANLIGNLFRDTDGIRDRAAAAAMRADLRRYAVTVVTEEWPAQRSGRVSTVAWSAIEDFQAGLLGLEPTGAGDQVVMAEMLRALNELYTARRSRIDAVSGHISGVMWGVIVLVGALLVAFVCCLGNPALSAHLLACCGFVAALMMVVALIVALDRPFRGALSVSTDAYGTVLASMDRLHPIE